MRPPPATRQSALEGEGRPPLEGAAAEQRPPPAATERRVRFRGEEISPCKGRFPRPLVEAVQVGGGHAGRAEDDIAEFLGHCHQQLRGQLGLRRGRVKWGAGPGNEFGESGWRADIEGPRSIGAGLDAVGHVPGTGEEVTGTQGHSVRPGSHGQRTRKQTARTGRCGPTLCPRTALRPRDRWTASPSRQVRANKVLVARAGPAAHGQALGRDLPNVRQASPVRLHCRQDVEGGAGSTPPEDQVRVPRGQNLCPRRPQDTEGGRGTSREQPAPGPADFAASPVLSEC